MPNVTRRGVLGGLVAGLALPALAEPPLTSPRPMPRGGGPSGTIAAAVPQRLRATPAADLIAEAGLGGTVTFAVADARTGLILEASQPGTPMPPASTAKIITSLYALDTLGAGHRFSTRLIATGPVTGGRIAGDLVLAGGGDPTLTTDDLGDLAAALAQRGITGLSGRFLIWEGALPQIRAIDTGQPEYVGYNPAVSGLNLNFNRLYFEWKRSGAEYDLLLDARAERFQPRVYTASMAVAERRLPVFTHSDADGIERWTVARPALGRGGGRWLPVRHPGRYAGDVFQTLARAQGLNLPAPESVAALPGGEVLATTDSETLPGLLQDMLLHSTNVTAEAIGLSASRARGLAAQGAPLAASAGAMAAWLSARTGANDLRFADHSGLGGGSRISAAAMAGALAALGRPMGLRPLLKPVAMLDAKGRKVPDHPLTVTAKTGTLNFVSALAGFIRAPGDTELAFAIFTADVARRDAILPEHMESPAGGADWIKRSKRLQQRLIERWGQVYGA